MARFGHFTNLYLPDTTENIDAATVGLALTPSSSDEAVFVDNDTERLAFTPSATELYEGNMDAGTEEFELTPSSSDTAQYVDADTEFLRFGPSSTDTLQAVDAATERLTLTITAHECYVHVTPEYQIDVEKRWNMGQPFTTWRISDVDTRWKTFVIGVGFEIPC